MHKKWQEFDNIKTPESWIEETLKQTKKTKHLYVNHHLILTMLTIFCLVFGSIGVIYATNPTFREWLSSLFSKENVQQNTILEDNEKYGLEDIFLYIYKDEEMITKVYTYKENDFVKKEIQHFNGQFNHQDYTFDYVIEKDRILSFHHTGVILKTYAPIFHTKVYVWLTNSNKNNLGILDLKTQQITQITNDDISVNSIVSPQGEYILINKNDQYWSVYDRVNQKESRVNDIYPYAHSNEVNFIDESHVVTYGEEGNTIIIDLKTGKVKKYDVQTLDTTVIYLDVNKNGKSYLRNILNDNSYELKDNFIESYGLRTYGGRFLFFQDNKMFSIYDINNNKITEINSLDFNIEEISQLDEHHILFGQEEQIYVVEIKK